MINNHYQNLFSMTQYSWFKIHSHTPIILWLYGILPATVLSRKQASSPPVRLGFARSILMTLSAISEPNTWILQKINTYFYQLIEMNAKKYLMFYVNITVKVCSAVLQLLKELPRVNRTYDPVFNLRFWRIWGVVLYSKGYQMIDLPVFILLQLIQVLTQGSNLIIFMRTKRKYWCVRVFHMIIWYDS